MYTADYPLPNLPAINLTLPFYAAGLITAAERRALNAMHQYNPLLYDFCLKRSVRGSKGERFADAIFVRDKEFL